MYLLIYLLLMVCIWTPLVLTYADSIDNGKGRAGLLERIIVFFLLPAIVLLAVLDLMAERRLSALGWDTWREWWSIVIKGQYV